MSEEKTEKKVDNKHRSGRGPLGYGDPDDKSLRKTEKDVIVPKLVLQHAVQNCTESFNLFLNCAKEAGFLFSLKCKAEKQAKDDCLTKWAKDEDFIKKITDEYLEARSHYRRTGEPLLKFERKRRTLDSVNKNNLS